MAEEGEIVKKQRIYLVVFMALLFVNQAVLPCGQDDSERRKKRSDDSEKEGKLEEFEKHSSKIVKEAVVPSRRESVENFLPGPVSIAPEVVSAFQGAPVSHRSTQFVSDFQDTKRHLCDLTDAIDVEIMLGSGTMANEAIASHLSVKSTPGLILTNGHVVDNRQGDQAADTGYSRAPARLHSRLCWRRQQFHRHLLPLY